MGNLKEISALIIAAVMAAFVLTASASSAVYQAGADLQAAVDGARPGDTILVGPGIYEKVEITKSLTLLGDGARIRPGERNIGIRIAANDVTVSGFTVEGGFYGIHLVNSKNCTISNNTVTGVVQWGIGLISSDENTIKDNVANYNGLGPHRWYGIYLSRSNGNQILENEASFNGEYGICLFPSCSDNVISGNAAEGNKYGIYAFTDCNDNIIKGNLLAANEIAGIKLIGNCIRNHILENDISENGVVGIFLQTGSGYNIIRGNEIANNSIFGVQILEGPAGNNTIFENNISGSQRGILVNTDGNLIYNNRIFDAVIPAEDRGTNQWYAAYPVGGNFWAVHIGVDEMSGPGQNISGPDGFIDQPYVINDRARDIYPVVGESVHPIQIVRATVIPARAQIGTPVTVEVALESTNGVAQVSARTRSLLVSSEPSRYISMYPSGDASYSGTLQTALMGPGRYVVILTAKDARGFEMVEEIGDLELLPRAGRDFNEAIARGL